MRPKRRMLTGIREDLLYRLRWNILADLETIEIATRQNDQTINVPLFGHPHLQANESIANPPLSRVDKVCIAECLSKRSFDYGPEEYRYQPPAALTINNDDGSPITLGQFVTEVHAYLNKHIQELKNVKGELYGKEEVREDGTVCRVITYGQPYLPPNIAIFFRRVHAVCIDDGVSEIVQISVESFAEGEHGRTTNTFWATQRKLGSWHTDAHGD